MATHSGNLNLGNLGNPGNPISFKIRHFSKKNINNYKNYEKITSGKHAETVSILKHKINNDFIIKKVYKREHENIFYNEVFWLLVLQNTGYFPKIIRVDPERLTFWMTFCGKPLSQEEFKKYNNQIRDIEVDLYQNYNCFHNDIIPNNVCILNGKIYVIDCGWMDNKIVLPGYTPGRYGNLFPTCFSDKKAKCLELLSQKKEIIPEF
jgi:uncharacterized protein (DUF2344 family)